MMEGFGKYAAWLEGFCREVIERNTAKIGVCMLNEDGTALTGYCGEPFPVDKSAMAHHIQSDALMDMVLANAKLIVEAAEEQEYEE